MHEVIGVTFNNNGRIFYFLVGDKKVKKNITVIVETEWGLSFGVVMTDIMMKSDTQFQTPLKNIVRVASKEDYYHNKKI
ncbi:MAG: hypothetical protein RR703_02570 [Bacilli bacterium]